MKSDHRAPLKEVSLTKGYKMLYIVTGVNRKGRRFNAIRTTNRMHAMGINLWRGSVWKVVGGCRKLIKRVYN